MTLAAPDRRRVLATAALTALLPSAARAAPGGPGRAATEFAVKAGGEADQTRALQRALDETARERTALLLGPGTYRCGPLTLPDGAQLIGIRGATRLLLNGREARLSATDGAAITLSGLTLDGSNGTLGARQGLLTLATCRNVSIVDCDLTAARGSGIVLTGCSGEIRDCRMTDIADAAIFSLDGNGVMIARNSIDRAGDNGILVWRSTAGEDGSLVIDNRIGAIGARSGGSGQYGNGINVFRAGNVIVRSNRITDCAFTAVRGNGASNIQIIGNAVSRVKEVALYAEFGFEGAVIANNIVDGAAIGISVTNFNQGGRMAAVTGNIIRNLYPTNPQGDRTGVGIFAEADAAITGNVVEKAPRFGIMAGWGHYLRDVAITGNVVRQAAIGIGVAAVADAGSAMIADNMIAECPQGAIVGLDHDRPITGDLARGDSGAAPARLRIGINQTR